MSRADRSWIYTYIHILERYLHPYIHTNIHTHTYTHTSCMHHAYIMHTSCIHVYVHAYPLPYTPPSVRPLRNIFLGSFASRVHIYIYIYIYSLTRRSPRGGPLQRDAPDPRAGEDQEPRKRPPGVQCYIIVQYSIV